MIGWSPSARVENGVCGVCRGDVMGVGVWEASGWWPVQGSSSSITHKAGRKEGKPSGSYDPSSVQGPAPSLLQPAKLGE